MANEFVNKVIYGGDTLIDLTGDTAVASDVLSGKKFHLKTGAQATGTIASKTAETFHPSTTAQSIPAGKYLSGVQTIAPVTTEGISAGNIKAGVQVNVGDADDADRIIGVTGTFTADATAAASEILKDKTAYKNGTKLTGTMPNNGAVTGNINTKAGQYTVPQGYHDGSGKVGIASAEQAKIIADNIKSGITILGVEGTYTGEEINTQNKTVTPDASWTADQEIMADAGYDYLAKVTVNKIPYVETDNEAGGKTVQIGYVAA